MLKSCSVNLNQSSSPLFCYYYQNVTKVTEMVLKYMTSNLLIYKPIHLVNDIILGNVFVCVCARKHVHVGAHACVGFCIHVCVLCGPKQTQKNALSSTVLTNM